MITTRAAEEDKWASLYMSIARTIAEHNSSCHSRKIGVVLVGAEGSTISSGYNGPPRKTPHCDSHEYIHRYLTPVLPETTISQLLKQPEDCAVCPRKTMGIPSGQHLEYCTCTHAELNTLLQAARAGIKTNDSAIYCWCCLPCLECTKAIIQAGVIKVVCLDGEYDKFSRNLFKMSNIPVFRYNPDSRTVHRETFNDSI